ncbi:hypothetical protein ACWEZE_14190 [Staphylococcus shinii]|uniref:hypothetical protein n=1 Tax=Staphylococcus shinii TaxID=2912228 RepID=UPI003F56EC19
MTRTKVRMVLNVLLSLITAIFILILYFTQNVSGAFIISYAITFIIIVILKEIFKSKQKRSDGDGNN